MSDVHTISFKTKLYDLDDGGVIVKAFNWKKTVSRADCTMRPQDHKWYNADMFPAILNKMYQRLRGGEYVTWCRVDKLPPGVTVTQGKSLLATVTVELPADFK